MRFYLYPIAEYRTDDPTWVMWRINYGGKDYLMAYSNGKLKEVYFVGEKIPNYFMSCRADDLYHVSHYYVDRIKDEVRRYEGGEMNRVYHDNRDGKMWCDTHVYTQKPFTTETPNLIEIVEDLNKFLKQFQLSGLEIKRPEYVK